MNNRNLILSVIIPAYNEAQSLPNCLASINRQSVQPDEILVINNGSEDNTEAVAKSFKNVRVVTEHSQGRVYARNTGFSHAKGDILIRIDADTIVPENWLERIRDFYEDSRHLNVAYTGGAAFKNVRFPKAVAWLYGEMAFNLNHLLIGHPTLWGSNMAITKPQWQKVGPYVCLRNDIHEDLDLSIHVTEAGYKIYYDKASKVEAELRRVHSNRHELWQYLLWWPRTLRVHRKKTWPVCWIISVVPLYLLTIALVLADTVGKSSKA